MSRLGGCDDTQWAHDICRIWCFRKKPDLKMRNSSAAIESKSIRSPSKLSQVDNDANNTITISPKLKPICCICGFSDVSKHEDKGGLIKCAAVGCTVMFHPMCATLVTKLLDLPDTSSRPTNSFTLDLTEVSYEVIKEKKEKLSDNLFIARGGKNADQANKTTVKRIIPVGFCCLHNPKREKSLYGCTPKANIMSHFMNIPYQH